MAGEWTVGGAIKNMTAGLKLRAELSASMVFDSFPGEAQPVECVWIGDAESDEGVAAMRRTPTPMNEQYDIDVFTEVIGPGKTAEQVRDRALAINKGVLAYVAENRTLGDAPGVLSARVLRNRLSTYPTQDGRHAVIRTVIRVTGRR